MSTLTWQLLAIGLAAGFAGGMFGIGGGAIMVPAMVLLLGLDQKLATGTSIVAQVLPIGLLGAVVYWRNGNLRLSWGLVVAVGLVFGNLLGALLANQPSLSSETIKRLYGVFLVLVGARYLFWK